MTYATHQDEHNQSISCIFLLLCGFPIPLKINFTIGKLSFIYIGVFFVLLKLSTFWVLTHLFDYVYAFELTSQLYKFVDGIELLLQCYCVIVFNILPLLQYKLNLKVLKALDKLLNDLNLNCKKIHLTFNILSSAYFVYFSCVFYLMSYSIVLALLNFSIIIYVYSSVYQIMVFSVLKKLYKTANEKMITNPNNWCKTLDEIDSVKFKIDNYFGPFNVAHYIELEFVVAICAYFIIFRVNNDGYMSDWLTYAIVFTFLVYIPYFTTFYAWKLSGDIFNEVSLILLFRQKLL